MFLWFMGCTIGIFHNFEARQLPEQPTILSKLERSVARILKAQGQETEAKNAGGPSDLCPSFPNGRCIFQTDRQVWHQVNGAWEYTGRHETVQCEGDTDLIQMLGLSTPIGLEVNGPWAAMLMNQMKTVETRDRALEPAYRDLPIAILDYRNYPSLVEAMGLEVSQQACVLGQLTFQGTFVYHKANSQDIFLFQHAFEKDPMTNTFGGHRVPCALQVYADQLGKDTMYGWHVRHGSVQPLAAKTSTEMTQSRSVVDAVGRWRMDKVDMCFLPSGDEPGEVDPLGRTYDAESSPINDYSGMYHCIDYPSNLDGSIKCLGTVRVLVELPTSKNKLVVILMQLFFLGLCGIDRCYMGQVCCGVVKGVSCGGLFVWCFLDFLVIFINSLLRLPRIEILGYSDVWLEASVQPAFIASLCILAYWICVCGRGMYKWFHRREAFELTAEAAQEVQIELTAQQSSPPLFSPRAS